MGSLLRPFPPVRDGVRLRPRRRGRRNTRSGPAGADVGPADDRRALRRRTRPRCCSPATRCTPTSRRTRRAARCSAGCWSASASSTASRCPVGGAGAITDALVRRAERAASRCSADRPWRGSSSRTVGSPASRPPTARTSAVGSCSPTATWPRLMTQMVGLDDLPSRYVARHRPVPARRVDVQGRLGAVEPGAVDRSRRRTVPAPSTSPTASTSSPSPSAQIAMRHIPDKPFLLVGQMTTVGPDPLAAGHRVVVGLHPRPQHATSDAGDDGITRRVGRRPTSTRSPTRIEQRIEAHAPGFTSSDRRPTRDEPA